MAKYIVMKKGIFGTLYVDSPLYRSYPTTTRKIEDAYEFSDLNKAEKIARSFFGEVIELENDEENNSEIIYCKDCAHYKNSCCDLNDETKKPTDFCSKAEEID